MPFTLYNMSISVAGEKDRHGFVITSFWQHIHGPFESKFHSAVCADAMYRGPTVDVGTSGYKVLFRFCYKKSPDPFIIVKVRTSVEVELEGIEPSSKQGHPMLSTRLFRTSIVGKRQDPDHQSQP